MNHLNSVLLEGVVFNEPYTTVKGNLKFLIESHKQLRNGKDDVLTILCTASGSLAEANRSRLKNGITVRVLGRLKGSKKGVFIKVQHIEYSKFK